MAKRTSRAALLLFRFPRLRRWLHKVSAPWWPVGVHKYDGSPESMAANQTARRDAIEERLERRRTSYALYCGHQGAPDCCGEIFVGISGRGISDRQEALELAASAGWYWYPFAPVDIMCPACRAADAPHDWMGPASGATHCRNCGGLFTGERALAGCPGWGPQPLEELEVPVGPVVVGDPAPEAQPIDGSPHVWARSDEGTIYCRNCREPFMAERSLGPCPKWPQPEDLSGRSCSRCERDPLLGTWSCRQATCPSNAPTVVSAPGPWEEVLAAGDRCVWYVRPPEDALALSPEMWCCGAHVELDPTLADTEPVLCAPHTAAYRQGDHHASDWAVASVDRAAFTEPDDTEPPIPEDFD